MRLLGGLLGGSLGGSPGGSLGGSWVSVLGKCLRGRGALCTPPLWFAFWAVIAL